MTPLLPTSVGLKQGSLLCLIAGAITPFAFAPLAFWPVAIISAVIFCHCLTHQNTNRIFLFSWLYGLGMFGVGASWVYVSIHVYGYAPAFLAGFLTILFVIGLAFVFALPFCLLNLFNYNPNTLTTFVAFPSLWVLGEWLRSWLLTGFPWLYSGNAMIDSPLAGWLPITGVWGASFAAIFFASAFYCWLQYRKKFPMVLAISLFFFGMILKPIHWTQQDKAIPINVGVIQPNFSQHEKWNPENRGEILERLQFLSMPLWNNELILWPEAAVPQLYQHSADFLGVMNQKALETKTTLITGIPYAKKDTYFNSIIAIGNGEGMYHKSRLVPFGEYVPLESLLRGVIRFFNLPMSNFSKGPERQKPLRAGPYVFSPFICYEIVYPDLVAQNAIGTDFLLTVSNDSWFGRSWGPLQHLQIARTRAIETRRYLIRGTNNGISAIISPTGELVKASRQFKQEIVRGEVYRASGSTPFMKTGSSPILLLCIMLLVFSRKTGS